MLALRNTPVVVTAVQDVVLLVAGNVYLSVRYGFRDDQNVPAGAGPNRGDCGSPHLQRHNRL
jgi:hypothetical protein